jgi:hypothetical protein
MTKLNLPINGPHSSKVLLLLILFCFLVVLFIRIRLITVYTPNIGGIEQNVIFSIQNLASGNPLYSDPEKNLYSFTQYSPLYFYIVAYTGNILGLDPAEPISWYRLSRIFSLIFNFILLFVVYKTLLLFSPRSKLLSTGLTLMLFIFFEQQVYSRPDSLYHLFFGLTIFYYYRLINNSNNLVSTIGTGISLALALFSKQSAIFLAAALIPVYFIQPQTRTKFLWFLLSFFGSVILLTWVFLSAPADILIKNLYIGILNGFDLRWAIKLYYLMAFPRFFLFFLVLGLLIFFKKELRDSKTSVLILLSFIYFIIALLSGLKWGSGTNYFMEFCILTTPGIVLLYEHFLSKGLPPEMINKISFAILLTLVVPQLLIISWRDYYKNDLTSYAKEKETAQLIQRQSWFTNETRFIIPERKWLANFFYDKTLFAQPDIYLTLFDPDPSISRLHPALPSHPENIFVIRSATHSFNHYFGLDLEGYSLVLSNDPYRIYEPSQK